MTLLRLKDLGRWHSGGTPPRDRPEHWNGDVPWISAKDIASTRLRPTTTFITHQAASEHSRVVPARSLLLIVRGMALAHGLPVVETDVPVAFNQDLRALVCAPGIDPRFVFYSIIGHRWRLDAHIDQAAHGTARVIDTLFTERIDVPDQRRQRAVVSFLDRESARITSLLAEIGAQRRAAGDQRELSTLCDLLAEYRDALITEAVTGQLDVTRLSDGHLDESFDAVQLGARPEVLAP